MLACFLSCQLRVNLLAYGWLVSCLVGTGIVPVCYGQEAILMQHRWEISPDLQAEWVWNPPRALALYQLENLASTDSQLRVYEAQRLSVVGAELPPEKRAEALAAVMTEIQKGIPQRRMAQAFLSAAIRLSDATAAGTLWEFAKNDPTLRRPMELALIGWKSDVSRTVWLERLSDRTVIPQDLALALSGLAAINATEAEALLVELVRSERLDTPTLLLAADTLGGISRSGLESLAAELLNSEIPVRELLVARILKNHDSISTETLMNDLLHAALQPAQRDAYRWFVEHRFEEARQLAESLESHSDHAIRKMVAEVFNRIDDEASLRRLGAMLTDDNVHNRRAVREYLIQKAESENWREIVDQILQETLADTQHAGLEQAIEVIVALQAKEYCPQLVELLRHPRIAVQVRAAWALEELAVDTAEELEIILADCIAMTEKLSAQKVEVDKPEIVRTAFLFEALGRAAYQPADEMLREYVPKADQKMRPITRTSAIWALGKLWSGRENSGLEEALAGRMLDTNPLFPEEDIVRYTSTLALGMIGTAGVGAYLDRCEDTPPSAVGLAKDWALSQLAEHQEESR